MFIWSTAGSRLMWIPKADATGLAPEKSAETLCWRPSRWQGVLHFGFDFDLAHFFGGVSERRPWEIQRDDRRAPFARPPNFFTAADSTQLRLSPARMACHSFAAGRSKKPSIQVLLPPAL